MRVFNKKSDFSGYGITLSYELNPNLYLLGSAEKAMRLPSANELFGNVNDNLLAPAGELKPETSYNVNVGVNWSGLKFDNHSIRLNTSLFYRDTNGMIRESIRAGSFTYSQFENLENVMSRGIDAEIICDYAKKFNLSFNISKFQSLFNTRFDANGAPYLFYRMQIYAIYTAYIPSIVAPSLRSIIFEVHANTRTTSQAGRKTNSGCT